MTVLRARSLGRTYPGPGRTVVALADLDLEVEAGAMVTISGASGSGKTTLLSLLAGLDRPTSGSVRLLGVDLASAPESTIVALRRDHLGIVFQDHHLVAHLTALDNLVLPALLQRRRAAPAVVAELVERLRLGDRLGHRPDALSRGERQRVGLARALVLEPEVVLADEPTASLDREDAAVIWQVLHERNRDRGVTVVVATHDSERAAEGGRRLFLRDGHPVAVPELA